VANETGTKGMAAADSQQLFMSY